MRKRYSCFLGIILLAGVVLLFLLNIDEAFSGCKNLKELVLPENISYVSGYAFQGCDALKEVHIPAAVQTWGTGVFNSCAGLEQADIEEGAPLFYSDGNSWGKVGYRLFQNCTSLKKLVIPKNAEVIPCGLVNGCSSLEEFFIPESVTFLGACPAAQRQSSYTVPDHVRALGGNVFEGCTNLKEVILPEGLEKIGDSAFKNCSGLEYIKIPGTVKEMGIYIFENCRKLKKAVLKPGIEMVEWGMFEGCSSLKKVVIPDSVKVIQSCAFSSCKSLTNIKIPKSVKELHGNVFEKCTSLKRIKIYSKKLTISNTTKASHTMKNAPKKMTIYVPKKKLETYKKMFKKNGTKAEKYIWKTL